MSAEQRHRGVAVRGARAHVPEDEGRLEHERESVAVLTRTIFRWMSAPAKDILVTHTEVAVIGHTQVGL